MKEIKTYSIGDNIPSNASFLTCDLGIGGENCFYYEVSIKDQVALEKREATQSQIKAVADAAIYHLNKRTGKSFKAIGQSLKLIGARINEGYNLSHFELAIDNMTSEWMDNPQMSQYLRPATLFQASKFDGYVNHKSGSDVAGDAFSALDEYM